MWNFVVHSDSGVEAAAKNPAIKNRLIGMVGVDQNAVGPSFCFLDTVVMGTLGDGARVEWVEWVLCNLLLGSGCFHLRVVAMVVVVVFLVVVPCCWLYLQLPVLVGC